MVYAEVELGKQVDWKTFKIQTNSLMKAPLSPYYRNERKYPNGGLSKKMANKPSIPNEMVNHSNTSTDDEKSGLPPAARRAFYDNIRGRNLEKDLMEMLDNEPIEEPLPHQASEEGDQGHCEEGEGSGPTMDEGIPDMETPYNPYEEVGKLKAIIEEKDLEIRKRDLKIKELEDELQVQKDMVSRLSGNPM